MESTSTRWSLNGIDVLKSLRAMVVVGVSAVAMDFLGHIAPDLVAQIPAKYAFILPVVASVIELIRRWATDHQL